jgi:hypothetical protein
MDAAGRPKGRESESKRPRPQKVPDFARPRRDDLSGFSIFGEKVGRDFQISKKVGLFQKIFAQKMRIWTGPSRRCVCPPSARGFVLRRGILDCAPPLQFGEGL